MKNNVIITSVNLFIQLEVVKINTVINKNWPWPYQERVSSVLYIEVVQDFMHVKKLSPRVITVTPPINGIGNYQLQVL